MNFRIGFESEDAVALHRYWSDILSSQKWTGGKYVPEFESLWSEHVGAGAVAFSSWWGAALCAMKYFDLLGEVVLCPSNTFVATPRVVQHAGSFVEFLDCSKEDLCLDAEIVSEGIRRHEPKAIWLVHIGGHLAFDVEEIARICKSRGVILLEDCAHAHGAVFHGKRAGTFGDCGVFSFHATKTISTGEGGMLVSNSEDLLAFAREFRDYGKPDYLVPGGNYRMSEFTAALGVVQTKRLPDIVAWKNEYAERHIWPAHPNRVLLPDDMVSGLYKAIVFDPIEKSTGKVYETPAHKIMGHEVELPNTEYISGHHWCAPLWYKGAEL